MRRRRSDLVRAAARPGAIHAALVIAAVAAWVTSLHATQVGRMTDLGLVSVLAPGYYVGLLLLMISFCIAVSSPQRHWALLLVHLVVLILILDGTPAILYGTVRYSWAWKHAGIVDYFLRTGHLSLGTQRLGIQQYTAYQDWPAFFGLSALIVKLAGVKSALAFASWAPALNSLLWAGAVMFLCRSLTTDRRLAWLATWLFVSADWVSQNYFSPQATAYFLYLVCLGICLRWLSPRTAPSVEAVRRWVRSSVAARDLRELISWGQEELTGSSRARGRSALVAIVVVLAAAIVAGHQLTPFMLVLSLSALVVFQFCLARGLPVVVTVMAAAWAIYVAVAFLEGNLYWIVASIGSLNVGSSTLSNLAKASSGHSIVADVARLLTPTMGILAIAGFLRRVRHGHFDLAVVLLVATPALMVWGNAYGGEMLFRIYLFALPFLAFLAAGLIFPTEPQVAYEKAITAARELVVELRSEQLGRDVTGRAEPPDAGKPPDAGRAPDTRRWVPAWLAALAVCLPLLAGMLVAYYGNDRMYYFSPDTVRSAEYLVDNAPAGSRFIGLTTAYPWAFRYYERYAYVWAAALPNAERRALVSDPVRETLRLIGPAPRGYVVFSRTQAAEVEMTGILPRGAAGRIESAIARSPRFNEVYRGPDAQIFEATRSGR